MLSKQSGDILYFGRNLESFAEKELAREVAYLQQSVEVGFGYTGKDIVLAGRYPYMKWWKGESIADEELALKCMEYTGTRELAERPVNEVSGGQKQRVAIASAIVSNREIIVFDEPTSGLDLKHMREVARSLKSLADQGKTLLVITHDPELVMAGCSYVVHMEKGQVKESYPLDESGSKKVLDFFRIRQ